MISKVVFFRALGLMTALASGTGRLFAEDFSPIGPEAGRELAAQLCSMRPEENQSWNGTLKIYPHNQKAISIPISGETSLTETNWSATYDVKATATTPAEKLKIIFFTNAPPQYFYARAASPDAPTGELKPLANAEADIPLAGSDFWLSDLGLEFFHWPDQIRQKGHVHRSRSCYLLDCLNPHPAPGGYSKVALWVDKESGQPLDAEAYGTDKKLLSWAASKKSMATIGSRN
jgi:hypothetical protein